MIVLIATSFIFSLFSTFLFSIVIFRSSIFHYFHLLGIKLVKVFKNFSLLLFQFKHFFCSSISSLRSIVFTFLGLVSIALILIHRLNILSLLWLWRIGIHFNFWHRWLRIFRSWLHWWVVIRANLYSVLGHEIALLGFSNISYFSSEFVCLVSHICMINISDM